MYMALQHMLQVRCRTYTRLNKRSPRPIIPDFFTRLRRPSFYITTFTSRRPYSILAYFTIRLNYNYAHRFEIFLYTWLIEDYSYALLGYITHHHSDLASYRIKLHQSVLCEIRFHLLT